MSETGGIRNELEVSGLELYWLLILEAILQDFLSGDNVHYSDGEYIMLIC